MKQKDNLVLWAKKRERFFSGFTLNEDKSKQHRSLRYAVMLLCALTLGIGNAWAHSTHYGKAVLNNATGNGTVYLSTSSSENKGQTGTTGTAGAAGSTSYITWNCGGSSGNDSKTYYARGTANDGYYFAGYATSSTATSYTASTTGWSPTKASSTSSGSPTTSTIYGFFKPVTVTAAPSNVNINATDPSATYNDAAGTVVSFTTANSNKIGDFTTSESGDSKWVISAWTRASASSTTFNYKFVGNGSYGTNNRTFTKTVTLTSKGDASSTKTCTLTAKYPNPRVIECNAEATDLTIYPTFKAADATQEAVEKTAVFDVVYADNGNNFTAAFSSVTGGGAWNVTEITVDQNNQKATVTYTFNGNKIATTHTAVLTLTANNCQGWDDTSAAGGASATVTLTAENTQEATNDASVTTTANVTTEYATFAQALAAANATSGATLTLLRNVDLGTITATNNITKAMTIDLNGKELRAAVNATSVGILTITKAVAVTIKDSKTGGKIINEIARNSEIRTIFVNAAGASLTLESGTLAVNNLGQYASKAATVNGVAVTAYTSCSARVIHQNAGTTVNITGSGKLDAKGTRSVYGIVQGSSAATNKAGTTVLNVTGGEIAVEAPYNALGIYAYGKVNMSAGVINTHITTNLIDAAYAADHGNNTNNGSGYGILMKVSVSATASSCYYGTLEMTGGTINVISDRKKAADLRNYGIYLEAAATGVGAGKTATDGTLSQKASAKASIENANITVHSNTYYSYGIIVCGSYNSYDNKYFTVPIKNCNIDVQAYLYTYAICANAAVNGTYGGKYWGDVELTGNTVTAESVTTHTAHAVLVVATTAHIFKDANTTTAPIYFGEYAVAAKAVINSGTYTAKTKTTTAFAVCSSTRAKTIYDSETQVQANRKPGGNAEAYPILIIHGGTFRGEATTTTSRAVSSGGYTTIDGGTFEAFSTSTTAYGLYAVSGKLTASGATISANATQYAYGAYADCGVPTNNTAQTGFAYAGEIELNNCDITATTRTSTEARGVSVNATNKMHNWKQFKADSTSYTWATTTYNAYKSVFPCTVAGHDSVGIAIAAKATINGCDIKVTAGTTTAYGVYSTATSVPASADSVASPVVDIKNTKFTVKTDASTGSTTAIGVYAGGPTTIDGCDFTVQPKTTTAKGVYAYDKKTTITNTKFDVKATSEARLFYAEAAIGSTTGWDYHGEFELGEGNECVATATGGNTAHVLTLIATKRNIASGKFAGDYANASSALVTGGSYKATATGTTCYAVNLSAEQVQGAVKAAPSCTIEGGKFWAKADGGTTGICTTNGVAGSILFKGGVYNVNTTLSKHIPEGYEEVPLASDRPEYTEGYRFMIEPEGNHGIYVCQIGSTKYKSLEEALQVVTSGQTILMIANYVMVEPGDYVLPAGATLLVPRSGQTTAQGTSIASSLRSNTRVAPSANLTLTFGNGVNLAAFGTIETGGLENDGGGGAQTGCTHGSYGRIILRSGAHIDLESGAKLQCWGYITGDGTITAKSGSQVYEYFEIAVCKGGTILSGMIGNSRDVFPLDDYFYQNIESEITYKPGCQAFASSGMYIQGNRPANGIKVVGNTTSHLFSMSTDGSRPNMWVKKKYDPTTDRCTWTLNDGAQLSSINITISGYGMNSSDYVLPIASSMDIVMNYGTLSISSGQNVMLNPGSRMIIKKDATLKIPSGVKFYVWDVAQWNLGEPSAKYAWSSLYQPDRATNPRSGILTDKTNLPSGEIFVQGTLEVSGDIQTTGGGAYIHSTNEDAGQVVFKTSATATGTVYQYTSGKNYTASSTTSAKLQNGDGTYEATAGSANGDKWIYRDGKWVKVSTDGCFVVETISGTPHYYAHPKDWVEVTANSPDDHAYHVTADPTRFVIQGKDCNWIEVVPADGYYKCINENSIYYNSYFEWSESNGYWVEKFLTIKFNNQGTVTTYSNIPYKSRPFYQGTTPTKTSSDANYYYVWTGWDTSSSNTGAAEYGKLEGDLPEAIENTTYYAHFDEKYYQYNITFKNDDGTVLDSRNWNKGTTPFYEGTPTKNPTAAETYEFNGTWTPAIATVSGSATYVANYTSYPRAYTITFLNYDMSVLGTAEVVYNGTPSNATYQAAVAPKTEDPYKPDNSAFSFEFAGWRLQGASSNGFAQVKGDQTYIAQFAETTKKYRIEYVDDDGETLLHWTQLEFGETPSYTWDNPNKQDAEWTYSFTGWTPATFSEVQGPQTYVANYDKTKRKYDITWVDGNGATLKTDQVAYGETPAYSGATPTKTSTSTHSYVFNNTWSPAIVAVVGEATYTAQFNETERQYRVTWDAATNGGTCGTDYTDFSYNAAIGTLPVATKKGHKFNGWFTSATGGTQITTATKVTADVTYHAQFTINKYDITWVDGNGATLKTEQVEYGQTPNYTGATPTKTATAQYTYTFNNTWSPAIVAVTEDATYTAQFGSTVNKYEITWVDGNGETLKTEQVEYGTTPAYTGATPTKTATAQYTYTFNNTWSPAIVAVTGAATYTAQFGSTVNKYEITWVDGNGETLKTEQVEYGTTPAYTGATPTKTATDQYTYSFNNTWSPAIVAVTGAATYTAQFGSTVNKYDITWVDGNGATLKTEQVEYGQTPAYSGETPTKTATDQYTYTFNNTWSPAIVAVTEAATYTAQFGSTVNEYTITWVDGNGATLKTEQVEYGQTPAYTGETPTKDATAQYTYTFTGWDNTPIAVTGEATYTAQFGSTVNEYTITWVDGNGATLKTEQVEYGQTPEYTGETPTKTSTAQYSYTFNNTWSPAIVAVTGEATYTAQFGSTVNKYDITWVDGNGVTLKTEQVEYGQTPAYTGETPTKDATSQYTYTFTGWDNTPVAVTGEATYTAQFSSTLNKYTITFKNGEDVLQSSEVEYGTTPTYTGATPTKDADAAYTYTFNGWTPAIASVTVAATYTAVFTANPIAVLENLYVDNARMLTATTTAGTTTITTSGKLNVPVGMTLTTTDLIILGTQTTSGQLFTVDDNVTVTGNAYYKLTLNANARTWYAVGVPWQVDPDKGIYGDGKLLVLGKDFDIVWYDGKTRDEDGPVNDCYKFVENYNYGTNGHIAIEPGKMYFMFFARKYTTITFVKKEGTKLIYDNNDVQISTRWTTGNPTDQGWNGIANPTLIHVMIKEATPDFGYCFKSTTPKGQWELVSSIRSETFVVGKPIMVQLSTETMKDGVNMHMDSVPYNTSSAPVRKMAVNGDIDRAEVLLTSQTGVTDRILCKVNDEAEDTYTIGQDLVKFHNDDVPQLWINNYKHALAVNTIRPENNTATYPLTIVSPKAGDYTLSLVNKLADGIHLYLTLNGEAIADLTEGAYTLPMGKETNKAYGLRLVRGPRGSVTGVDEALDGKDNAEKVIMNGMLFIIRQGKMYDAQGKLIEN